MSSDPCDGLLTASRYNPRYSHGDSLMDTIALTYRELAERLGVKPESARKTAQRKRWRRSIANDGTARVHVPLEALPVPEPVSTDVPGTTVSPLEMRILALEVLLDEVRATNAVLHTANEDLRSDRDRWHHLAMRPWWKRIAS